MRVMVIVKATKESEAELNPGDEKLLKEMGAFNEELGKRVKFSGAKRTVTDGPFAETKELVAGYWLWQVKSMDEAVEWVKRCPNPMPNSDSEIEIRPLYFAERSSLPAQTLFMALAMEQRQPEALAVLEKALERRPADLSLLLFSARENGRVGRFEPAQALLDRAAAIAKGTGWYRVAAEIASFRLDHQAALQHWKDVLRAEPLAVDAHEAFAKLLAHVHGRGAPAVFGAKQPPALRAREVTIHAYRGDARAAMASMREIAASDPSFESAITDRIWAAVLPDALPILSNSGTTAESRAAAAPRHDRAYRCERHLGW